MICFGFIIQRRWIPRVSVQGVKSLGGHFACLCWGFDFYEVKKFNIIFQKEKGNTFTLLIELGVESLWGDCTLIPSDWGSY